MSTLEVKTEPLFYGGRIFYGLLRINDKGLITSIDLLVNNIRYSVDADEQWVRQTGEFPQVLQRYRQVVKQKYYDKLAEELR